jgi:hypothetical protein
MKKHPIVYLSSVDERFKVEGSIFLDGKRFEMPSFPVAGMFTRLEITSDTFSVLYEGEGCYKQEVGSLVLEDCEK